MPDGTIGVVEYFPGRVIQFDSEGIPTGTFLPGGDDPTQGGFRSLRDLIYRGDNLVGCGANMSDAGGGLKRTQYLASFDTKFSPRPDKPGTITRSGQSLF